MILILSDIEKKYAGKTVLSRCSYRFERNGIHVLMGPNGCGKSTLLRICALLEEADTGAIGYFSGSDILKKDLNLRRRMTLVLPRLGLFNTSVFHNVAYGLAIRGITKNAIAERVRETLAFVGLENRKDQHALTLSTGETQRVGIARALAIEPEFLFLDEPTASVDEENTGIIESIIETKRKDDRTTIIMTTHDRAQAKRLADRLLVIRQGAIADISKD